jgi:hypothetical protein
LNGRCSSAGHRRPTDHLGYIVLEPRRADAVMRFVNGSVGIQDWVVHHPINKVIDHRSSLARRLGVPWLAVTLLIRADVPPGQFLTYELAAGSRALLIRLRWHVGGGGSAATAL